VTFKAKDSEGMEHSFVNEGYWGPEGGFDIPAEYEATTEWKLVFSKAGNYTITFSLIDADTEQVIADITDTVEINVRHAESGGSGRKDESPKPETKPSDESRITITTELDRNKGVASGQIDEKTLKEAIDEIVPNEQGIKLLEIDMTKSEGAKAYEMILPPGALTAGDANININTAIGSITLPGNMLPEELTGAKTVSMSIALADKSKLSQELQQRIGDRPVIELNLKVDGKSYSWSNDDVPVTVAIPYTPTEEELRSPEHITVWYIDSKGNIIEVPSGRYDPETSSVIFSITHFSQFAVVYVTKAFDDLDTVPWARKAIEVLASKGIIRGKTETEYAPQTDISRAEFLYSLVRTLGVTASFDENFDDIEIGAYYYKELGIAKKIGIAKGIGNNKFSPNASITRQDLMVLAERALRMLKKLETHGGDSDLDRFEDKSLIAEYAIDSIASLVKEGLIVGSENRINPLDNTSRAEAAVFLYRIYTMIYGSK